MGRTAKGNQAGVVQVDEVFNPRSVMPPERMFIMGIILRSPGDQEGKTNRKISEFEYLLFLKFGP